MGSSTHYSWLSIGFYCFGIMYVIQWIYKSITNELNQQKKIEQQQQQNMQQQQQMMNPMNPYQPNMAFGQANPYGYVQPGYRGMYGAGMPMIGQPQPPLKQTQQQNNQNNEKSKDKESSDKKESDSSESLLAKPKDEPVHLSG